MQAPRSTQVVASVVIIGVTAVVIAVSLAATTPIGCGPANALGLKSLSKHCLATQTGFVYATPSPSPYLGKGGKLYDPNATPPPYSPPPVPSPTPAPVIPPNLSPSGQAYPPYFPPLVNSGKMATPLALNCRLPVYAGQPGSGGFIAFPDGTFIPEAKSGVTLPSPSPGSASPQPGPGYYQGYYSGLSYDVAYKKWVPAQWSSVTPDGSRYAYPSFNSIYVQNVTDSKQVELGEGKQWSIVSVEADGVYASNPSIAGLWFLPYSGSPRQITTAGYWQAEAAGAAYGTETSAVPQGASNTILRLDLKTGASTPWFTRDGATSAVAGFDSSGNPIIYVTYFTEGGPEVWITTSATTAVPVMGPKMGVAVNGTPIADSHGIWFSASIQNYAGTSSGQVLYVPGSGVYDMVLIGGQLAGGCS